MSTFPNTIPPPQSDGMPYCDAAVLPASEADLFNEPAPFRTPIPILYAQAIMAVVKLTASGTISTNSSYVVLQTALEDETWVDVAWCVTTFTSGIVTFVLSAGMLGANAAVQNSRVKGTAPGSTGTAAIQLGGRIRLVGQSTISPTPTGSSGGPQVTADIRFREIGLR